jgi:hypothetical protein
VRRRLARARVEGLMEEAEMLKEREVLEAV